MRGGNAVDAAITAALVAGVVDPQMCGIAGFGSCQIYDLSSGRHESNRLLMENSTGCNTGYVWEDRLVGETRDGFGFVLEENINDLGYGAVTTPGSLLAYFEAARDYGSWDWEDIVAPAVAQAKQGFLVRPHVYFWWNQGADYGRVPVEQWLGFLKNRARKLFPYRWAH